MSLSLDMKIQIRSMIFVAGEPIPLFWPMRAFIHHNPLHGLEKRPFHEAVSIGEELFHGAGFLPRATYQRYYREGRIDRRSLVEGVEKFVQQRGEIPELDQSTLFVKLLTEVGAPISTHSSLASAPEIGAALRGERQSVAGEISSDTLAEQMCGALLSDRPLYESLDNLFNTGIGEELDELVIKSCLDFFDEGQSVWHMPERERGFFTAWREVANSRVCLSRRSRQIRETLQQSEDPEGIIAYVMESLELPQSRWIQYFRHELARLHGWAGFIRWRSGARNYYHGKRFPGDLVDLLAIRLTLALALIRERAHGDMPAGAEELRQYIRQRPMETCMRQEFHTRKILPAWAQRVEMALQSGNHRRIEQVCSEYLWEKRAREASACAAALRQLAGRAGVEEALPGLDVDSLTQLLENVRELEKVEGMIWLEAMESNSIQVLLQSIQTKVAEPEQHRPFAQALFCIDTRSERLRRHLESVGDYQTFGIAGFFGVPVSFMELGKGSEIHMCPVILTPKNLVMEMSVNEIEGTLALSALEKAVHELKESVLSPFVTVEAIGLLFGFDMVGKTLAPSAYHKWRTRLHHSKPHTHLMIDKLNREQADSIVRAVQRAVIARAVEHEFEVAPELIKDDLIRELREAALGHVDSAPLLGKEMQLETGRVQVFVERLRTAYRINPADARMQMERLGRIGFSLDEQVVFVSQALHAIGLTDNFSRFILVVGHGSQSENNPYESALDCGACGGNVGIYNARIFAHMANKPAVRKRLRKQGISIPDDAWFVPTMHNTTTDEMTLHDLDLLPSSHPIYLDRLQNGLVAACRLCTQERAPSLDFIHDPSKPAQADKQALRNAMDWSQVRPEWGLSRNVYFVIGRRSLTESCSLDGRAFLHSYDYRVDRKRRLLDNILTGPLVVAQWINMEHYFSTVDNEHYGSGSKAYHNVAGRFAVMTGNLSDLRTGLPAQTVLAEGQPYHEPMRLITVIEAPFKQVLAAIDRVAVVRRLLINAWIRILIVDPESGQVHGYDNGQWQVIQAASKADNATYDEAITA